MAYREHDERGKSLWGLVIGVVILLIVAILGIAIFGYIGHGVKPNEIGIRLRSSRIVGIVGPGIYTDLSPFADIVDVKIEGLPFCAEDPEVLTRDQQRIGLKVCGTVHRPGLEGADEYRQNWAVYRTFYVDDKALLGESKDGQVVSMGLMTDLSQQAMKVCVGDRNFSDAAVGEARDVLRECIGEELGKLTNPYGLTVRNVVVPNIIIDESVQALLDSITESKFQTDLARQNALKAEAEANRQLAEEQGRIRVEQGRIQELEKQKAITADLERQALEAQLQVIVAEKANELKNAELALEVSQAELEVERTKALAELADVFALAGLYQDNPDYLDMLIQEMWANAWNATDKVIIPAGTQPTTVLSPDGADITTVVPATP